MKKKLLVAGCLVALGLLGSGLSPVTALAQETINPVVGVTTKATVVKQTFTLSSSDSKRIYFTTTNKEKFASKFLFKIKAENPNNDYFGVEHYKKADELIFNSNSVEEYKYSAASNVSVKADEIITITNYSAVSMKFTIAYTMGIQMKEIPCIDYRDIDFDL